MSALPIALSLPGMTRQTLARTIAGQVSCRYRCPGSYPGILAALIEHAGTHSDTVWPCEFRIAEIAAKASEQMPGAAPAKPVHPKTVGRALAFFVKAGVLRRLKHSELDAARSELDWIRRGGRKIGSGPVAHYDLAPLGALIPQDLAAKFESLKNGTRSPRFPAGLFKDNARQPENPGKAREIPTDPFADIPDPFADPSPAPLPAISQTLHLTPPPQCNVLNTKQADRREVPPKTAQESPSTGQNCPSNRPAPRGKRASPFWKMTRQGRGLFHILRAKPENGGRGFDPAAAMAFLSKMEKRFGGPKNAEKFVSELIAYAKFEGLRQGDWKGPGWLTRTAEEWNGTWSAAFERHLEYEKRAANRLKREEQQTGNAQARRVVTTPNVPPNTAPNTPAALPAIPPELADAWPAMLAAMKGQMKEGDWKLLAAVAPDPPDADGTVCLPCHPFARGRLESHRSLMEANLAPIAGAPARLKFRPVEREATP